ncbi:MAG: putative secreted protein [Myxococcaceae bacterium]|nr:putative secreted protein [Myxococcaceae bacterium]
MNLPLQSRFARASVPSDSPSRWTALLMAACLFCFSCAAESDAEQSEFTLALGTGESSFAALTPGQRVQMVAGTQGGYHVWLSLRASGFHDDRLRMQLALRSDGPVPLASSDLEVTFEPVTGGAPGAPFSIEHVGWPAQLLEPWCAVDRTLSISATVTDGEGHRASASIQIVPTAPQRGFPQSCTAP